MSWFRPKDNSLLASTIGGAASISGTAGPITQTSTGVHGVRTPITTNFTATGTATNTGTATLFGIFDAGAIRALPRCPAVELGGQDPGRTESHGARRSAGAVHRRRAIPLPGPAEFVDPGGHGGRHRPVRQVRGDPDLPAHDPGQRRDPARRRADLQPAQLRGRGPRSTVAKSPRSTSEAPGRSSSSARGKRWRSPACCKPRPTPPPSGSPASATCRSSGRCSAGTESRLSRPSWSCW